MDEGLQFDVLLHVIHSQASVSRLDHEPHPDNARHKYREQIVIKSLNPWPSRARVSMISLMASVPPVLTPVFCVAGGS